MTTAFDSAGAAPASTTDGRPSPEEGRPGVTTKGRATRARLMDAAQLELQERGVVEIASVAAEAGVAQSVIHRYFGNKAGLVEAVINRFYDEYDEAVFLAEIAPGASWLEREAMRIDKEVGFLYDHPLGPAVAAGLLHEAAATRVDAERQRRHAADAANNIRHGQRSGELSAEVNADLVGAAIIGALRSVLATALSAPQTHSRPDVSETITLLSKALLHET